MTDNREWAVKTSHYVLGVLFVSLFVLSVPGGSQEIYVVRSSELLRLLLSSMWAVFSVVLFVQLLKSSFVDVLPPLVHLVIFAVILVIGITINDVKFRSVINGLYIVYFWVIVLAFTMVCKPIESARKPITMGVIIVGSICAVVSIFQMINSAPLVFPGDAELRFWSTNFHGRYRAHSFFTSALPNSALMTISGLLVLDKITSIGKSRAWRKEWVAVSVYLFLFLVVCAGVYTTHTRAAYGTFAIAVACYLLFVLRPDNLIGLSLLALGVVAPLSFVLLISVSDDYYSLNSLLARRDILREIENITYYLGWGHQLFGLLAFRLDTMSYYHTVIDNGYVLIRLATGIVGQMWFFLCYLRLMLLARALLDQSGGRVILPVLMAQLFAFVFNNPIHMSFAVLALLSIVGERGRKNGVVQGDQLASNDVSVDLREVLRS